MPKNKHCLRCPYCDSVAQSDMEVRYLKRNGQTDLTQECTGPPALHKTLSVFLIERSIKQMALNTGKQRATH